MNGTLIEQQRLLNELQKIGFNVVRCGTCPEVFIHRSGEKELHCPYCRMMSDPCDFPDIVSIPFYERG